MKSFLVGSVSLAATLAFAGPRTALAQETAAPVVQPAMNRPLMTGPARIFSAAGHLAISSDAGFSITNTSITGQSGSTTTIQLRPAVDYFVVDNVSVGGFLGLDYTNQAGESGHTTAFSIGPRAGYNVAFSDMFSVWPKLGFSYSHTSISQNVPTTNIINGLPVTTSATSSTSSDAFAMNIFVPIMFHPVEHFFIGFGPAFDLDLTGDNKATTIAGRLTIGGWI